MAYLLPDLCLLVAGLVRSAVVPAVISVGVPLCCYVELLLALDLAYKFSNLAYAQEKLPQRVGNPYLHHNLSEGFLC